MRAIIRHMPGLIGAIAAFIIVRMLAYLGLGSTAGEFLAFLLVYLAVTVAADRAMLAYSRERTPGSGGL